MTKPADHFVRIPEEIWNKLWREARKRKKPTQPAELLREILNEHFGRKKSHRRKPARPSKP